MNSSNLSLATGLDFLALGGRVALQAEIGKGCHLRDPIWPADPGTGAVRPPAQMSPRALRGLGLLFLIRHPSECPSRPGQRTWPWAWPWPCRRGTRKARQPLHGLRGSSLTLPFDALPHLPSVPGQGKEQDREWRILCGSRPMTLNVFHSGAVQYGSH